MYPLSPSAPVEYCFAAAGQFDDVTHAPVSDGIEVSGDTQALDLQRELRGLLSPQLQQSCALLQLKGSGVA